MDRERWRRIEEVYQSASELPAGERDAYLRDACGQDEDLRREVESLLAQASHGTPLDRPAWELAAGARLGPYELLEPIGQGGMGTVFKALDTRLNRSVAIKVSSAQFSGRFAIEARAVAALNHPHVCTLHDVGPNYLVMEFVDGENLAQRLEKGRLPLDQALRYAVEIADAVAAAHARGIVHRDLKPGNIMLTKTGGVKVLDFGLAKLADPGVHGLVRTATPGVVGTLAYMSPEQAGAKPVDTRSDIFSLGAVLYEMVTGNQPFRRDTEIATLAAVIDAEPEPVSKAAPGVPPELERIIKRCLRKDPARRFQTPADLKVELEELSEENAQTRPHRRRRWLWIGAAVAVVTLGLGTMAAWRLRDTTGAGELSAQPLTSYAGRELYPSLSPDGNKVAFAWNGEKEDNYDIYVKQIGPTGTPMRLTTDPSPDMSPVWSPDDRWIAFRRVQPGKESIVLISPLGGPERKLVENLGGAIPFATLSWTPDAKWLAYSAAGTQPGPSSIWAISVETGERRRLTTSTPKSAGYQDRLGDWYPSISPGGGGLAFARQVTGGVFELYVLRVTRDLRRDGEPARITDQRYGFVTGIAWTGGGDEIVYAAGTRGFQSLWRVPVSGRRTPKVLPYALPAVIFPTIARAKPRLVYAWEGVNINLWRLDRRTKERKMLIGSTYWLNIPQYSPDGRKIAFQSNRTGSFEVWAYDAEGSNCQQLTSFGGPGCGTPRWSPDGQWLALDSRAEGQAEIYVIPADGGAPRRITDHPAADMLPSWSRDGRWIYFASDRGGRFEV